MIEKIIVKDFMVENYYVSKQVGVWGWPNANVSTKAFFRFEEKKL